MTQDLVWNNLVVTHHYTTESALLFSLIWGEFRSIVCVCMSTAAQLRCLLFPLFNLFQVSSYTLIMLYRNTIIKTVTHQAYLTLDYYNDILHYRKQQEYNKLLHTSERNTHLIGLGTTVTTVTLDANTKDYQRTSWAFRRFMSYCASMNCM